MVWVGKDLTLPFFEHFLKKEKKGN